MEIERRKFQGALNILSFNRHFYIYGLITLLFLVSIMVYFNAPAFILWIIVGAFLYGLIMPLLVSAYVYDFSGYYDLDWLKWIKIDQLDPKSILNINGGFDETSFIIKNKYPDAELKVYDFYDADRHTEPAIVRARKVSLVYPDTSTIDNQLPDEDNSVDIIFLLSAIHEMRTHEERVSFLRECHRVCSEDGQVITVEHLRDFPNFVAFTIGFTHFFSRSTWRKAFKEAGFRSFEERKFTPFMSIFVTHP